MPDFQTLQIEEKEAVAQYGSTDSGASLGDILGAALGKSDDEGEAEAVDAGEDDKDDKAE